MMVEPGGSISSQGGGQHHLRLRYSVRTMTSGRARVHSDVPADVSVVSRWESESLSARVRRGAAWNLASIALLRLVSIFTTAIVAHILNPRDFGIFAVATTVYTIVSSMGEFGVSLCIIRADLDLDILAPTMNAVSLASCTLLAGGMVVFAKPIATALGSPYAAEPVKVMALVLVIVGVFNVPTAQLARDFKQDKLFLAEVISFVPSTALLLILANSGSGAMAFAWSRVLGQFVSGCVVITALPHKYRPGIARSALSVLFRYGFPLAVANFVNYILLNVDYALVGHLLGATLLGIYVLAFNVASWPSALLSGVQGNVTGPAISRVRNDPERLKDAVGSALRAVALVAIPMCTIIMLLSHPLVATLYGARWAASAKVLSILCVYCAISVICNLFANILAGVGKAKILLVIQLVWLGALVPAMSIGVHRDGIIGAAVAHIAVIAPIVLPAYLFTLIRVTGVSFAMLLRSVRGALLASLAMVLVARAVESQLSNPLAQLVCGAAAGGLVYIAIAGPQAIVLLTRGKPIGPRTERILRLYRFASRSSGPDKVVAFRTPNGHYPADDGFQAANPERVTQVVQLPVAQTEPPVPKSAIPVRSIPPSPVVPVVPPVLDPSRLRPAPTPPLTKPMPIAATWTALVSADRVYYDRMRLMAGLDATGIEFPAHTAQRQIPLTGTQMRIGRQSRTRDLEPEINLADPGISRLHAVLVPEPGGTWALLDSGSANGTLVNGTEITPGELVPLHDGDRINLGAWTAITVRSDPEPDRQHHLACNHPDADEKDRP